MNNSIEMSLVGDIVIPTKEVVLNCELRGTILGNLEAPLCREKKHKRRKAGPYLISHSVPHFLRESILSLANNHAMDYGDSGLQETLSACKSLDITPIGFGCTLEAARQPHLIKRGALQIGILARCETQFGAATQWRSGVAVSDAQIYTDIRNLKNATDVVVVSVHGSAELSPWPSPQWRGFLRSLIDAGATIVHGHHAHVPQGYEEYNRGLIFYGLGNFIADPERWKNIPNALWSVVGHVKLSKTGIEAYHIETITIKNGKKIEISASTPSENILHRQYLSKISACIRDDKLLLGIWQEISLRLYRKWYGPWLGFQGNGWFYRLRNSVAKLLHDPQKVFLFRQHIQKVFDPHYRNLRNYHLFACETHRDAIGTALGTMSGELDDLRTEEIKMLVNEMAPEI